MSQSPHKNLAKPADALRVTGDYMEVYIGRIILDAKVRVHEYDEKQERFVLFETVFSNVWDYRIHTYGHKPKLIDSDGFQHSAYTLGYRPTISGSSLCEKASLPGISEEIEGRAKSLGWIAFPQLRPRVVPDRLVFRFDVFDPGSPCGTVRHSETLEILFDLSLLGRLLKNEGIEGLK